MMSNELFEQLEPRCLLAGVTLVAHGQADGGLAPWVTGMADVIEDRIGPGVTRALMTIDNNSGPITATLSVSGADPLASATGEIVIAVDWTDLAGGLFFPSNDTVEVAEAMVSAMLNPGALPGFGHALAELPIHLIGHSRGASLMSEVARRLGDVGVWVEHLTLQDPYPHPLGSDASVGVPENVVFADNIYQSDGFVSGDPVAGAVNRSLPVLSGGYGTNHSDVHLWYHATIDDIGSAHDGEAGISDANRDSWYAAGEGRGSTTGFYYSRLIGGDRPDAGVHTVVGGAGSRQSLSDTGATWSNIVELRIDKDLPSVVRSGVPIPIDYTWDDADSGSTLTLRIDTDRNPYNGSAGTIGSIVLGATGGFNTGSATFDWNTHFVGTGTYYVSGEITDGATTRYVTLEDSIRFRDIKFATRIDAYRYQSTPMRAEVEPPSEPAASSAPVEPALVFWMG